jgi:hypothetical protein
VEPCYAAIDVLAAFADKQLPFGTLPPREITIRLGSVLPVIMDNLCLSHGLHVLVIERRQFSDGEDTVYVVRST